MEQLYLIPETNEERLSREVKELKESMNKQRKRLFAENGALKKMFNDLKHEHETFISAMCRGNV